MMQLKEVTAFAADGGLHLIRKYSTQVLGCIAFFLSSVTLYFSSHDVLFKNPLNKTLCNFILFKLKTGRPYFDALFGQNLPFPNFSYRAFYIIKYNRLETLEYATLNLKLYLDSHRSCLQIWFNIMSSA